MYRPIHTVLFIVAVFTVCESAANVAKRCDGCEELKLCLDPLHSFQTTVFPSFSHLTYCEQYEELCRENTNFKSCFAAKKENCDNSTVLKGIADSTQVFNHLCSDEGRGGLQKIADSECVTNETTLLAAQNSAADCSQNFVLDTFTIDKSKDTICPYIDQLNSCIISSVTNHCGQEFGNFTEKIWGETLKPIVVQMGCGVKVRQIRHLINRIYPLALDFYLETRRYF